MITELLLRPEIQSAVLPLLVSLIFGLLLRKVGRGWAALGITLGFIAAALAINGLNFTPLTGTRKIILLTGIASIVAMFIVLTIENDLVHKVTSIAFLFAAFSWVFWGVLSRKSGMQLALMSGGGLVYLCWLIIMMRSSQQYRIQTLSVGLVLGLGTGIITVLGSSALLGQLAFALAAAIGAYFIIAIFSESEKVDVLFMLPVITAAGLTGYAGILFARVPWYGLLLLALVPLAAYIPVASERSALTRAVIFSLLSALPAALAIVLIKLLADNSSTYY